MSKEAVEAVFGKAMLDDEFRDALFADPDQALMAYDLSEEERLMLSSIDAETMGSMAGALDERISKSTVSMDLKNPGKPTTPTKPIYQK